MYLRIRPKNPFLAEDFYAQISALLTLLRQDIFGTGNEKASAAGLAPDALVARTRRPVAVVAREELALVNSQLIVNTPLGELSAKRFSTNPTQHRDQDGPGPPDSNCTNQA